MGIRDAVSQSSPKILGLPRCVADELVLAASLCHILVSDISADWASTLFATDSSDQKGAIVSAPFSDEGTRTLWTSSLKAADSSRLMTREKAALQRLDPMWKALPEAPPFPSGGPGRPLALRFHFLEVCGGTGKIGAALRKAGYLTGPLLDLSESPEYNWESEKLFSWVTHLVSHGLVDAVFVSSPCTTFSPAAPLFAPMHVRRVSIPRGQPARTQIFGFVGNMPPAPCRSGP